MPDGMRQFAGPSSHERIANHTDSGHIIANEGGHPTNFVQGGINNRQIINPELYLESFSIQNHNYLPQGTVTHNKIIEDLYYSVHPSRHEQIATTAARTYEWILQYNQQPADFRRWLETNHEVDLYWISGKAGSGKSTLMKFLASHPHVKDSLVKWAGFDRLFIAQHYFWFAGSAIEASEEGLLRSLLYQVCNEDQSILEKLFPPKTYSRVILTNISSLRDSVRQLSQIGQAGNKKFCFFLDALDEYRPDVEHTQLAKFALSLACLPNIKVVVSCRPWTAFERALTCRVETGLCLQEHTREDIRQIARNRLDSATSSLTDHQITDLTKRVQQRSQGIFLWAHLVTGSLQQRAMCDISHEELIKCLDEYPTDLHAFFRDHIFQRIHSTFRESETAKFLKFAMMARLEASKWNRSSGQYPSHWLNYWLAIYTNHADNDTNLLKQPLQFVTPSTVEELEIAFSKRLNASCRDLLRITRHMVLFTHRSVFDFLMSKEMNAELIENVPAHFLDERFFLRIFIANCKMTNLSPNSHMQAVITASSKHQASCLSGTAATIAASTAYRMENFEIVEMGDLLRPIEELFLKCDESICKAGCKHFLEIGDAHDQCLLRLLDVFCAEEVTRYANTMAKRLVAQLNSTLHAEAFMERCKVLCYYPPEKYIITLTEARGAFFKLVGEVVHQRRMEANNC